MAIPPHNTPEPDIVVTTSPEGTGLIPLDSVRLIVEVADTTLGFDLGRKLAVYAEHGIAEYWVVDVNSARLFQFWEPVGAEYAERREVPFKQSLAASTIAGLTVSTAGL